MLSKIRTPIIVALGALCLCLGSVAVSAQGPDAYTASYAASGSYTASPGFGTGSAHFAWADVLRVEPVVESVPVTRTRRKCHDVSISEPRQHNTGAATVIGAIAGGVIGSAVGDGDGRKVATVVGALAGGAIGHQAASADEPGNSYVRTRCRNVPEVTHERRVTSYDVEYRYHGDVYLSRLAYDPGERLRVRVSVTPAN